MSEDTNQPSMMVFRGQVRDLMPEIDPVKWASQFTLTPLTKADLARARRRDEWPPRRSKLARRCAARGRG